MKNKKLLALFLSLLLALCSVTGCGPKNKEESSAATEESPQTSQNTQESSQTSQEKILSYENFTYEDVPAFSGESYVVINDNQPFFTEDEIRDGQERCYEFYSDLDALGRCGFCMASLDTALMPTEPRGDIYMIHPTGWQKDSGYERAHLIAFQLCGENANEKNLITSTHMLNGIGMLPFEEMVGDYVRETNTRVLYRVTPIFVGDELVARGVLMEAYSLSDGGEDIEYCIFCYNLFDPKENRVIDYNTGICYDGYVEIDEGPAVVMEYVVNKNSGVFHLPDCEGVANMAEKNKMLFTGTFAEAKAEGYRPCGACLGD